MTEIILQRPPMAPYQLRYLNEMRDVLVVWVGAGTKTGKTVMAVQEQLEYQARGLRCAWVGPYLKRARMVFRQMTEALQPAITAGHVTINKNEGRIEWSNGGGLELYSGDNPESIYGDGFALVTMDEGTRHPESAWWAARSTVTATGGKLRVLFNTDRQRKHWCIREFLRAKAGVEPSYGWMTLATAESLYVAAENIEQARRTLPDRVFRALYLAEVQDDGAGVFRGIEECIGGSFREPEASRRYAIGVDLARKRDWTVSVVLDAGLRHVVAFERFFGLPWREQRRRIAELARRYNGATCTVDATGVGDPNIEELIADGVRVDPFVFTSASKPPLIDALIVAIEQRQVTFPQIPELVHELENFEYQVMPSGRLGYEAADGEHDDCVAALALALHGARDCARSSLSRDLFKPTYRLLDMGRIQDWV